ETALPIGQPVALITAALNHVTRSTEQLLADDVWERIGHHYYSTGMRYCMLSIYPLDVHSLSGVGFHRRAGKPNFSERERLIVHAALQQVDWLHREGTGVPVRDHVLELTPRQRQVLLLLLAGDGRKRIAAKLGISEHTVSDYLKDIYRRLNVTSGPE